jgi:hypothetical protein
MREADHPRVATQPSITWELVVGRMLELVVYSVEGVRERFSRTRLVVH